MIYVVIILGVVYWLMAGFGLMSLIASAIEESGADKDMPQWRRWFISITNLLMWPVALCAFGAVLTGVVAKMLVSMAQARRWERKRVSS